MRRLIELISRSHDRAGFDCGTEPLNLFLKQNALNQTGRGISRTFVMVERAENDDDDEADEKGKEKEEERASASQPVLGFFALSATEATPASENWPPEIGRNLPRRLPAVRLGRLAVSQSRQRQGIGRALMVEALKKTAVAAQEIGIAGLFVDAKDQAAADYYRQFGFVPLPDTPLVLFLPRETLVKALQGTQQRPAE